MFVRQWLVALPFLVLVGQPGVSQAQDFFTSPHGSDRGVQPVYVAQRESFSPMPGQADWIKALNLNAEQKRQLQAIAQRYKPQINQRQDSLRQLRTELRAMMSSDTASGLVRQKYRQVESLQEELRQLHFESILEMREVLTPEQRRQFEAHMQSRNPGNRGTYRKRPW